MNARLIFTLLLVLVATGSAAGVDATIDSDPAVDFGKYRTYAWAEGSPAVASITHERIVAAVESHLQKAGLTRVESDPDLLVSYHGSATDEVEPAEMERGYGGRFFGGVGWQHKPEKRYRKGTLVLQLGDTRSEKLVWRGTATDAVSEKPEKNTKKIDQAVKKLFSGFPPRKP